MTSRIVLLSLLLLCVQHVADACSCSGISDRMIFARSEAIVVLRIERTWPTELPKWTFANDPGAFSERVVGRIRRAWMAPELAGSQVDFENSGSQSVDCGEKPLALGSIWLIDMTSKSAPGFHFSDCSWARYWNADPARIARLDQLAAEFSWRRQMDQRAWDDALRALLQRAQAHAGLGAEGCSVRLAAGELPAVYRAALACIKKLDTDQRAFWAIVEDPFEQNSRFYALARSPSGVRSAWQGVLRMSNGGQLQIDVGSLEERRCGGFGDGLRMGLSGLCFDRP